MGNPYAPPGSRPPAGDRSPQRPSGSRTPPPLLPPRPPLDPQRAREALRGCAHFALLVLAGLIALSLGLPWQAGSLAFFIVGAVMGVLALRACHRAGIVGSVPVALVMGLIATGLLIVVELTVLAAWGATASEQRCREQALTVSARDACSTSSPQAGEQTPRRDVASISRRGTS